MSKDKYQSIFSRLMEASVFIILQIVFRNTRSFQNWGIFSDIPGFSCGIFGQVTCLDQSRASENICFTITVQYLAH